MGMARKTAALSPFQRLFLTSWPGMMCICVGLISYGVLLPSETVAYTANTAPVHTHNKPVDLTNMLQHGAVVTKRQQAVSGTKKLEQAAAPKRKLRGAAAADAAAAAAAPAPAPQQAVMQEESPMDLQDVRHVAPASLQEPAKITVPVPAWHSDMQAKAALAALQTDAQRPMTEARRAIQRVSNANDKQPKTPMHAMHTPQTEEDLAEELDTMIRANGGLKEEVQLLQTATNLANRRKGKDKVNDGKVDANRAYHRIRNKASDFHTPIHAAWDEDNHEAHVMALEQGRVQAKRALQKISNKKSDFHTPIHAAWDEDNHEEHKRHEAHVMALEQGRVQAKRALQRISNKNSDFHTPIHAAWDEDNHEAHVMALEQGRVQAKRALQKISNKKNDFHTPIHAAWDEDNHEAMHESDKTHKKQSKSRNAHHAVRKNSKAPMDPHHHAPEEHH